MTNQINNDPKYYLLYEGPMQKKRQLNFVVNVFLPVSYSKKFVEFICNYETNPTTCVGNIT